MSIELNKTIDDFENARDIINQNNKGFITNLLGKINKKIILNDIQEYDITHINITFSYEKVIRKRDMTIAVLLKIYNVSRYGGNGYCELIFNNPLYYSSRMEIYYCGITPQEIAYFRNLIVENNTWKIINYRDSNTYQIIFSDFEYFTYLNKLANIFTNADGIKLINAINNFYYTNTILSSTVRMIIWAQKNGDGLFSMLPKDLLVYFCKKYIFNDLHEIVSAFKH